MFVFDVDTRVWRLVEMKGEMPTPRYLHSATAIDHMIYIIGGCLEERLVGSNDVYVFNTHTFEWQRCVCTGDAPDPRYGHSATYVGHKQILVFGGASESGDYAIRYNDLYLLDTANMRWNRLRVGGTPPIARALHTAAGMGLTSSRPLLYIFAGDTAQNDTDFVVLDMESMRWTRPLYEGQFEVQLHAADIVSEKMLVLGGLTATSGPIDDFYFINTVSLRDSVNTNSGYTFKIILAGNSGAGKSSLMSRFTDDEYNPNPVFTIGVDFKTVTTIIDGNIIKLRVWDTAGQERFRSVSMHYFRGADAAILVYDTTSLESFEQLDSWLSEVDGANSTPVQKMVVGTKTDLASNRQVTVAVAEKYAKSIGAQFVETSAKDSRYVDAAFLRLARELVQKRIKENPALKKNTSSNPAVNLQSMSSPSNRTGCCE
eukprot:TRINITY_DN1814_c0_g1_i6.p1 TRINITY_DN1814_c0_g1~~TRINITY_DN1814_c0_g1_i6.p1  ORF type:complete len:429 (+),score=44.51 TRINITY_DN1814_c0_g1_i6:82-1368(+)